MGKRTNRGLPEQLVLHSRTYLFLLLIDLGKSHNFERKSSKNSLSSDPIFEGFSKNPPFSLIDVGVFPY